ncbi:MAG: N-acetylmuramoyl-L-alanine amidase, partial [Phycisphaerae bacterium]|nr:N-acetylmuramoyl-L-alanine amidase [Phycisphaerae bacterium]
MAGRLNLSVERSSRSSATLRDETNSVMVFADPGGQAFVNSRPVGRKGNIVPVGEILFMPQILEPQIRLALRVRPRRLPAPPREARMLGKLGVVVLDPGHGGRDPGAISIIGVQEKWVVLRVSLVAAELLRERGVDVKLTRSDDRFIPLNERAKFANDAKAKLFVSVHADSARNHSARGCTVYVANAASAESRAAAKMILDRLASVSL